MLNTSKGLPAYVVTMLVVFHQTSSGAQSDRRRCLSTQTSLLGTWPFLRGNPLLCMISGTYSLWASTIALDVAGDNDEDGVRRVFVRDPPRRRRVRRRGG